MALLNVIAPYVQIAVDVPSAGRPWSTGPVAGRTSATVICTPCELKQHGAIAAMQDLYEEHLQHVQSLGSSVGPTGL